MASKLVTKSNGSSTCSSAASASTKCTLVNPRSAAIAFAVAMPSVEKSKPVKVELGKASAMISTALPEPQPMSASVAPASSASMHPGMSGNISSSNPMSNRAALCSAINAWKAG